MLKLVLTIESSIAKGPSQSFQIHLPRTCLIYQIYEGIGKQWKSISPSSPQADFQLFLQRADLSELEADIGTNSTSRGLPLPRNNKELSFRDEDTLLIALKDEWYEIGKSDLT